MLTETEKEELIERLQSYFTDFSDDEIEYIVSLIENDLATS